MKKLSIISLILFFQACMSKDKIPADILPPDKMQALLWDVIQADVFTNNFTSKDSSKNLVAENIKLQQQVFGYHKVTKESFYTSYHYYVEHTELMSALLDSMTARAERSRSGAIMKKEPEADQ